ncbi:hypothetical protein FQZ97_833830 [compost metagenome]
MKRACASVQPCAKPLPSRCAFEKSTPFEQSAVTKPQRSRRAPTKDTFCRRHSTQVTWSKLAPSKRRSSSFRRSTTICCQCERLRSQRCSVASPSCVSSKRMPTMRQPSKRVLSQLASRSSAPSKTVCSQRALPRFVLTSFARAIEAWLRSARTSTACEKSQSSSCAPRRFVSCSTASTKRAPRRSMPDRSTPVRLRREKSRCAGSTASSRRRHLAERNEGAGGRGLDRWAE